MWWEYYKTLRRFPARVEEGSRGFLPDHHTDEKSNRGEVLRLLHATGLDRYRSHACLHAARHRSGAGLERVFRRDDSAACLGRIEVCKRFASAEEVRARRR